MPFKSKRQNQGERVWENGRCEKYRVCEEPDRSRTEKENVEEYMIDCNDFAEDSWYMESGGESEYEETDCERECKMEKR